MPDLTFNPPGSGIRNRLNAQTVVDRISEYELKHGAVISWAMLYEWLGFRDRPRIYPIITIANAMLQEQEGIFLDNIRKLGYQIVERGHEVNVCLGVVNKGIKKVRHGIIMMNHIRLDKLEEADRSRTIEAQQKAAALYRPEITA